MYNRYRIRPTQPVFPRRFLEAHRMEFLCLFVASIPLVVLNNMTDNFQNGIEQFFGSQTVSSISPPFRYDVKSGYPSFRTI